MAIPKLPDYKDMPPVEGMPHGTAWGLFDKDGEKDEVGTFNLLTPEVVIKASSEIKTGRSVVLNWSLDRIFNPGFGRTKFQHKILDWREKIEEYSYDDEITINTQSGSQWDGLRHYGYSQNGRYYNGVHHDDIPKSSHLGIDYWSKRGGIVGRGVLIDYCAWAEKKGIQYDPMSRHCIKLDDMKQIAKEQNIEFRQGDILIVRSGWIKWYEEATDEARTAKVSNGHEYVGVEGCPETIEWLWNNHFAAVAGDAIGFEAWPPKFPNRLHDHLLALWGMPIGELWDLEALSEECQRQNRWSFLLTSAPLNTPGGVASPPNAIAIF
ncbi:hypothetical protein P152DRAFT_421986 [Eremomyces bilateralis CBS 781.70]|uniref:Cyclase n=1 Tax=Eremomyces bilateralis CBS 781.70 TaxID=1392243 RepID=A0A6G1FW85_9PEZI|nr:uncharacterized protein P152DRAFT_421986 [Eremomyces bilateralis CBS 781.70]KAF1809940.1 hypothetical protein P152DRAFT_421986 [Eremomyces bilateralis CBS 781.70]